jgi:hypothetical protein
VLGSSVWQHGDSSIAALPQPASSNSGKGERQFSLNVIRDRCIEFRDVKQGSGPSDFRECRVSEFGELGVVEGETYYYATYCLIPSYTTEKGECGDDSFIARYAATPVRASACH